MQRNELVEKLYECAATKRWTRGRRAFALFLAKYLEYSTFPAERGGSSHLDVRRAPSELVIYALHIFVNSKQEWVADFRKQFEQDVEYECIDPIRIDVVGVSNRDEMVAMISSLVADAMGNAEVEQEVRAMLDAQRTLACQVFCKFAAHVLVDGGVIDKFLQKQRGISFTCAQTTVQLLNAGTGKTMVRFNQEDERVISFVVGNRDPLGIGVKVNFCSKPVQDIVTIIEEVTRHWHKSKTKIKLV